MTRFYFHVFGKTNERDTEGTELPSASCAKREGLKLIGAMLNDGFYDTQGTSLLIEIMDETGLVLFHIDLTTWNAPDSRAAYIPSEAAESGACSHNALAKPF